MNDIVNSCAKSVLFSPHTSQHIKSRTAEYFVAWCSGCRALPSHGLKDRLSEVISGHDNVSGIVRATPRKDRMNHLSEFPLLQRPVTKVNKKLHIWELNLVTQHHREGNGVFSLTIERKAKISLRE